MGKVWMELAMAETPTPDQRRMGTYCGLALIAFGLVGAVVIYVNDSHSMDFFELTHALDLAVLHAVLMGLGGLGVILWYNRDPNASLPPIARDDDYRDGNQ
jgi:hypothetical protein